MSVRLSSVMVVCELYISSPGGTCLSSSQPVPAGTGQLNNFVTWLFFSGAIGSFPCFLLCAVHSVADVSFLEFFAWRTSSPSFHVPNDAAT